LTQQIVTDEHTCLVAPQLSRCKLAPAHVALVDNVIMQQCSCVHEFHACCQRHVAGALIVEDIGKGECQHRAQPFAAGRDQVFCDLRDQLHIGSRLGQDQFIHVGHARGHKVNK